MPIISGSGGSANTAPGSEIGYDAITGNVSIVGTTQGAATTIITCGAHTFDGTPAICTLWCLARLDTGSAGDQMTFGLFETGSLVSLLGQVATPATTAPAAYVINTVYRFTPSSASHSYVVGAWVTSTTGSPLVIAGAGGSGGANPPAFIRFTKV